MPSLPTGKPITQHSVRELVETFMRRKNVTASRLAANITGASEEMYGRSGFNVGRDTINRLLGVRQRPGSPDQSVTPRTLQIIYNYLAFEGEIEDPLLPWGKLSRDPFFRSACEQYGVDHEMIDSAAWEYTGTFSFYAYSEELRDSDPPYIIRGAMSFFWSYKSRALMIKEMQRDGNDVEKWFGYFFERSPMCVIMARRSEIHIPKFYVLRPRRLAPGAGNREVTSLEGRMLKVGDAGDLFSSRVYMRRDKNAYHHCGVFPASQMHAVLPYLGPPPGK